MRGAWWSSIVVGCWMLELLLSWMVVDACASLINLKVIK